MEAFIPYLYKDIRSKNIVVLLKKYENGTERNGMKKKI